MADNSKVLLHSITLRNLLSFGSETEPINLKKLNVLIGPNGSGKSNLLESIILMRATASDIRAAVRKGGGVIDWIWKGAPKNPASIDLLFNNPNGPKLLRHFLSFREIKQTFLLEDERIENEKPDYGESEPYFFYRYQHGHPLLNVKGDRRQLLRENVDADQSILAQRRDPEIYPEITYLVSTYEKIRVYREWAFGRNTVFREPQKADLRNDRLEEDFSNLGLFLNRLRRLPKAKNAILNSERSVRRNKRL
jgi:predicted ATPase